MKKLVNNKLVECSANEVDEIVNEREQIKSKDDLDGFVVCRVSNYPPINEQLDMLYWDKINGTTKWEDAITNIKNNLCPKP